METCCKCGNPITGECFDGASGPLCPKCLKDMQVYYALRSMGLLRNVEEGNNNGAN